LPKNGVNMKPRSDPNLRGLNNRDRLLILFYVLWVRLRRPAFPRPVHFGVVACLCTFALLPVMPHHPLSMVIAFGGGLSAAILLRALAPKLLGFK
jgi:hypothetical protein